MGSYARMMEMEILILIGLLAVICLLIIIFVMMRRIFSAIELIRLDSSNDELFKEAISLLREDLHQIKNKLEK